MNRLRLDYQHRTQPFPLAGSVLLALAVALSGGLGNYYQELTGDLSNLETSLKKFEQASGSRAQASHQEMQGMVQDIKQANEILRQLTLPWENLFQAMESSIDQEVTLLGMEPDIEKHTVNISCEARNVNAMLNFIKRLKERREFRGVYLQNHQVQEADPQRPVRFSLIAFWRTAA